MLRHLLIVLSVPALASCETLRADYGRGSDLVCFSVNGASLSTDEALRTRGAWCKVVLTDETK